MLFNRSKEEIINRLLSVVEIWGNIAVISVLNARETRQVLFVHWTKKKVCFKFWLWVSYENYFYRIKSLTCSNHNCCLTSFAYLSYKIRISILNLCLDIYNDRKYKESMSAKSSLRNTKPKQLPTVVLGWLN